MAWNWGGAGKYGASGAALGSFIPGIGTLLGGLGGGLLGGLFGGGGQKQPPPDMSFYEGWGKYPTEAVEKGREAIMGQQTRWLEDAMRGITSTGYGRGLGTSSFIPEMGERAAGEAVSRYAPAMAELEQWGIGQQQAGDLEGKLAYLQMLSQYQEQQGGQNDNFIAQMMGFLGEQDFGKAQVLPWK